MLENLPKHEAFRLADQVSRRKYQVCSKSLCSIPGAEITLLAFDGGEGVSAEQYSGDTLYTVLDGACSIDHSRSEELSTGESIVFPEGCEHSLSCTEPFRILQLTVNK